MRAVPCLERCEVGRESNRSHQDVVVSQAHAPRVRRQSGQSLARSHGRAWRVHEVPPEDGLDAGHHDATGEAGESMNQCMGCQAGWPLDTARELRRRREGKPVGPLFVHRVPPPGYPGEVVACTADRYLR